MIYRETGDVSPTIGSSPRSPHQVTTISRIASRRWDLADTSPAVLADALAVLEDGGVLLLPDLPFDAPAAPLLDPRFADPATKNIAFDAASGKVRGLSEAASADVASGVATLLGNFHAHAQQLIAALAPGYVAQLRWAQASLRLHRVETRVSSWRKDDSRLHIDAFPSRPNQGERILRVFRNINPQGEPRVWRVGERFDAVACRFVPAVPRYRAAQARLLAALHVTKSLRSRYDHTMMHLHDLMKADAAYQHDCPQQIVPFAAGATWVCFSDQTSHAVMSGQFMLEQTAQLPVAAMTAPGKSPLAVLQSFS